MIYQANWSKADICSVKTVKAVSSTSKLLFGLTFLVEVLWRTSVSVDVLWILIGIQKEGIKTNRFDWNSREKQFCCIWRTVSHLLFISYPHDIGGCLKPKVMFKGTKLQILNSCCNEKNEKNTYIKCMVTCDVQETHVSEKLIQPARDVVNLRNNWKSLFEKNKFRLFKTIRLFVLDVFGIINYYVISPQFLKLLHSSGDFDPFCSN